RPQPRRARRLLHDRPGGRQAPRLVAHHGGRRPPPAGVRGRLRRRLRRPRSHHADDDDAGHARRPPRRRHPDGHRDHLPLGGGHGAAHRHGHGGGPLRRHGPDRRPAVAPGGYFTVNSAFMPFL